MADGPKGLNADGADRPGPPPEIRDAGGSRSKSLGVFVALFAVAAFAGVVWYAYDQGLKKGSEATAPVITADTTPIKVRPDKPGGMQVKNKDKLVYGALRPGSSDTDSKVEQLLPPPERPLDPPGSEAPAAQTGSSTAQNSTTVQITPPSISREAPKIAPAAPTPQSSGSIPPATLQPSTQQAASPPPPPPPAPATAPAPAPTKLAPPAPKPAPAPAPKPAAAPKPQPTVQSTGDTRIQLGAFRDEAAANSEWNRLSKRHEDVLGGLSLRLQRVDLGAGKGVFHRVQGGMVSSAEARRICAVLTERKQPCLVVRP